MSADPSPFTIDLDRAVLALSQALDYIGVDETGHGCRVGLMAAEIARQAGWDDGEVREVLRAGLLHDCGVSSTREHKMLIGDVDWSGAQAHCERGFAYLSEVPLLAHLAPVVLAHHGHWAEMDGGAIPASVALRANLIFLADRADAVRARGVKAGRHVADVLAGYAPTHFAPALFKLFVELSGHEAFWFMQDEPSLRERVGEGLRGGRRVAVDIHGMRALAGMFGRIIDAKSPFTERHSQGVARVARRLGRLLYLPVATLDMLEIAGLLHDLGKLRIPDEVLEKPEPLSPDERHAMARHAFDTWEILGHVFGDCPLVAWAAYHHEAVVGNGYPFHREGDGLSEEARVIAVADVFQALSQDRPYRRALGVAEAVPVLEGMVLSGRLDGGVVAAAIADIDTLWRLASGGE